MSARGQAQRRRGPG